MRNWIASFVFSFITAFLVAVGSVYVLSNLYIFKGNGEETRPLIPKIDRPTDLMGRYTQFSIEEDTISSVEEICAPAEGWVYTNPAHGVNPGEIQQNIGYKNNKFGLYIYAEVADFFTIAKELVNSNGGEWGYILLPYNVKDYDQSKWQKVFAMLNEYKLIPIIQLWDLEKENDSEQIRKSAEFLNMMPWPIEYRYISVFNETNDARFWFNEINPKYYAEVLEMVVEEYKNASDNYFIMNGAFNASAPTTAGYMDAEDFMVAMDNHVPGIFTKLDGWASHPYPQPNFTGSPLAVGRNSIRAYEWELEVLEKRFGVKDLPVFITETGWPHREGETERPDYLPVEQVAENIKYAFENVWLTDDRVVAITPFTVWYDPPYDHFSWVRRNKQPYLHYQVVKNIEKVRGNPPQLQAVWKCK